jgi:hypothetical protein
MPFEEHPSFPPPPSPNAKLWRYMDFVKLFSLLRSNGLYFPSAYQLLEQDPLEGSYTAYHSKYQLGGTWGEKGISEEWVTERNVPPQDWPAEEWHFLQKVGLEERRQMRKYIFINSWHMNEDESIAMWKLYDLSGNGLAVVSSFDRLKNSLAENGEPIYIGLVQYINYRRDEKWLGNYFDPFIHKAVELSHEKEVRAVVWGFRDSFADYWSSLRQRREWKGEDPPRGISMQCNLDMLIDYIVVSPTAPHWVFEMLKDYCEETIGKEVRRSDTATEPFF